MKNLPASRRPKRRSEPDFVIPARLRRISDVQVLTPSAKPTHLTPTVIRRAVRHVLAELARAEAANAKN